VVNDHSVTINNNQVDNSTRTVNNTIVLNDFHKTDLKQAILDILRDPAFVQQAQEAGMIVEALARSIFHTGALQNRSVHGIDNKGTTMQVQMDGKKCAINRENGLHHTLATVRSVANSPDLRDFLLPSAWGEILPSFVEIGDQEQLKDSLRRLGLIHQNGGSFPHKIVTVDKLPSFADESVVRRKIMDTVIQHEDYGVRHPAIGRFKGAMMELTKNFAYKGGRWFAATGSLHGTPRWNTDKVVLSQPMAQLWPGYIDEYSEPPPVPALHQALEDRTQLGWEVIRDPMRIQTFLFRTLCATVESLRQGLSEFGSDVSDGDVQRTLWRRREFLSDLDKWDLARSALVWIAAPQSIDHLYVDELRDWMPDLHTF